MLVKVLLLIVFFAVMIGIGVYTRKHATDVNGFVLGSRSAGPWITAFAYGTSYFFGSCICRICRTVWMEVWLGIYLDRDWECRAGESAGVGRAGAPYQGYEPASEV